jgi:hypothetical protein
MVRRGAFLSGLALGSGLCAWLLGSALTYLLTGKLPCIRLGEEKGLSLELVDVATLHEAPTVVGAPSVTSAREEV